MNTHSTRSSDARNTLDWWLTWNWRCCRLQQTAFSKQVSTRALPSRQGVRHPASRPSALQGQIKGITTILHETRQAKKYAHYPTKYAKPRQYQPAVRPISTTQIITNMVHLAGRFTWPLHTHVSSEVWTEMGKTITSSRTDTWLSHQSLRHRKKQTVPKALDLKLTPPLLKTPSQHHSTHTQI